MELKPCLSNSLFHFFSLLIELYGIETCHPVVPCRIHFLLIELYGIETYQDSRLHSLEVAFNRTIWN